MKKLFVIKNIERIKEENSPKMLNNNDKSDKENLSLELYLRPSQLESTNLSQSPKIENQDISRKYSLFALSTDNSTSSNSNNPSKASTGTSGVTGADIIAYAEKFVGKPYKRGGSWNGEMPYTPTDCVGFVKGVYKHFGISIPSNASTLINKSKKFTVVTGQPVQAGDIVLYAHHRALITGKGNKVVHAMGEAYGIGHSKNYKSCGAGAVRAVIRVNALSQ